MKKLLFLSAILIAVIMSACSSEEYKSYVPADSKVVAKLDFKEFIAQTGIDQEKLFKDIVEQYGDDVADFKNSGIDLTSPFYVFMRNSGSELVLGLVAKVTDKAQAEMFYTKSSKETLSKGADYDFNVQQEAAVAINDEVIMVVTKDKKDKQSMERTLTRLMGKDFEGSLADNKIFAQADGSTSFASLCADMSIIPDEALEGAGSMASMDSKDFEQLRSIVINLEGTATDGVCDFICSAKSDNKDMQERIEKARKAFGKISEKAFSSFSSGDMFGFAMNTDGAQLAELIKDAINRSSNEDMKRMMEPMIEQVSGILSKIRGNVIGVMNSPQDFIIKAEGVDYDSYELAEKIESVTGVESKVVILSYLQRGGSPTSDDRILATRTAYKAVELILDGSRSRAIGVDGDELIHYPLEDALKMTKPFKEEFYKIAMEIS